MLVAMMLCVVNAAWGADETVTFSAQGYSNQQEITSYSGTDFSITFNKGTNSNPPKYFTSGTAIRAYGGNTFTISSSTKTISEIVLTFGTSDGSNTITTDVNTYTNGTWTGSATAVTFTIGGTSGNRRLSAIAVTYDTGGGTPTPTTYTVTYDANGGTGTMTDSDSPYEADDEVTLLTNTFTAPEGKLWSSWSVKDASDNDITVLNGKFTMPASNVTVSAQWADDPNAPQYEWVETSLADLTSTDIFVIVGSNYAMTNNNGTSSAPAATAVSIVNGKITSTVAENIKWNISGNGTDGYTFYPNGSTTTWLYCNTTAATSSNNNMRVGTGDRKLFQPDNNGYFVTNDNSTDRYISLYNNTDWRGYVNTNSAVALKFYKRQVASTDPSISASDVNIAYDATEGSISYTINNPVQDGVVSVDFDSEGDWLLTATDNNGTVSFTCSANETTTERTATVTLTYTYNTSETVTKDVTITQAAAPVIYTTIPELFDAATNTETEVKVTFNNWVVSGVSTNGKNVFVTDNNGNGFVIFDNNGGLNNTYSVGSVLSGTAVTCNLVLYNGFAEIKNLDASNLTITTGGTVTAANVAMADLAGVNTGALVSYENLTCSVNNNKYYLSDGTTTIQVYNALYAFDALEASKTYNITGIYQQYNSTKELMPRSAADIVEVVSSEPSITVATTTVNVAATDDNGTIGITYDNLSISDESDFDIQFCDAGGNALSAGSEPTWIVVEVAEDNNDYVVSYIMNENTSSEARSAYFKVFAMGDADFVYSDLITVTQAGVVVDYATLPFIWAGGSNSGLSSTNGVTIEGAGTDYSANTHAPYLIKFDSDGDYIQVKTNAQPGIAFISVKMIGGGTTSTITVQESADGSDFEDVEALTISGKQNDILELGTTTAFAATTRYVRFAFTRGSNVGVGPITITKPLKLNASGYATIASTSALDFSTANYTAWVVTSVDGETINFTNVTEAPANTGLLLKGTEDNAVTLETKGDASFEGTNLLEAITTATDVTAGEYFGLKGNEFVPVNAGTIPAGKALLPATEVPNEVKAFTFVFVNTATGVRTVETISAEDAKAIFNLAGQRLSKTQRGINIVNGKKVVVK